LRLGTLVLAAAVLAMATACEDALPTEPTALAFVSGTSFTLDAAFDADFYRAFVRNAFEQPAKLEPIRRLNHAPSIYLKTVDEAGLPIDAATLDTTESAMKDSAMTWGGGQFGLAGVTRGTESREGTPGWITVKWANPPASGRCGLSTVGADGGWIEFNPLGPCSCGSPSRVYARVVRHELGHAFGYYHTDSAEDVMYGQTVSSAACDLHPSEREIQYAKYLYQH
jgi:hypothetical protein